MARRRGPRAPARRLGCPYLLKLLAAASSLSIQAHPSRAQAIEGFAREEAAGIPRDAAERTYRDENHKPELIVAVSETFTALAGLRDLDATRRLLALARCRRRGPGRAPGGAGCRSLRSATRSRGCSSGDAARSIDADRRRRGRGRTRRSSRRSSTWSAASRADFPGDRGIGVALLMNLVVLRRGEGLFVPGRRAARLPQAGLGVEIMAASDNVLRGGLTPKHVDVAELLRVLDPTPGPVPVLRPVDHDGVARFAPDVPDFALTHVVVDPGETRDVRSRRGRDRAGHGGRGERRRRSSGGAVELSPGARRS